MDDAVLVAKNDVQVWGGIVGRGEGRVTAGRHVKSGYIRNAQIDADGNVIVKFAIQHSTVRAGGRVEVSGSIIGGVVHAMTEVSAGTLGSGAEAETRVVVGFDPERTRQLKKINKERVALEKEQQDLGTGLDGGERAGRKEEIQARLAELETERAALDRPSDPQKPPRVLIRRGYHAKVTIQIGPSCRKTFQRARPACSGS